MKEGTHVEHLGPSQAGFCKPSNQNRGQGAGSYKAQIDCCSQVVVIAQFHSTEENHVAYNPKKSESFTKLHKQYTDDNLELLAGLPWRSLILTRSPGESAYLVSALWQSLKVPFHHPTRLESWLLSECRQYGTTQSSEYPLRIGPAEARGGIPHFGATLSMAGDT